MGAHNHAGFSVLANRMVVPKVICFTTLEMAWL
jgi:hypothetical protein